MDFFTDHPAVTTSRIIYTPSSFAKANLLHLQETGVLQANKQHKSSRKDLVSYLCFMVEKGAGTVEYNGEIYPLSQGDIVFLDCRKAYSHLTNPDLWSLRWVHFYGPTMQGIYEKYLARGGKAAFHPDNGAGYHDCMVRLFEAASSPSYVRDMEINAILGELMVLLMKDGWNPDTRELTAKKMQIQEVKAFLDRNYTEKITLDELSEKFYINKFYLSELFRDKYGIPVNEYLISLRITRSKELLRFTDKSIEEIAGECGFNSLHYYSRQFHKVEGLSPSEYRKRW